MSRLSPEAVRNARMIFSAARGAGLGPGRALELVAAAYAESGLQSHATNKSSGAAGLFQLLSSGYVNHANQLGGVYNPRANLDAILPDYVRYWKQHPNAVPGEAASAVEKSGQGPSFYASPLKMVGQIVGPRPEEDPLHPHAEKAAELLDQAHMVHAADPNNPPYGVGPTSMAHEQLVQQARQQLLGALTQSSQTTARGKKADMSGIISGLGGLSAAQNAPVAAPPAPPSLPQSQPQQTKTQAWDVPGPHGTAGPGKVDSRLIQLAHHFGLKITSGYRSVAKQADLYAHRTHSGSVAAPGHSYHNKGLAIDVAVTDKSKAFLHYAFQHPSLFAEVFYDPAGISIKDGKIVKWTIGGHSDHIHIAFAH